MTRPFIEFQGHHNDRKFLHLRFERGTKYQLWVWKIFITSVDTFIVELPNIHEPDKFNLCHGHSNNGHFQFKSMGSHLKRHIQYSFKTSGPTGPMSDLWTF